MPAERRTDQQIRLEIATEREQLASALADLRAGIDEKRKLAAVVGGVVVAGVAAAAAVTAVRRLKGE